MLPEGVREFVLWLQRLGWNTTDSGDGTNYLNGMEGALPYDHVVITTQPGELVWDADRLKGQLEAAEIDLSSVLIEANYSPLDGIALIIISDPDHSGVLRSSNEQAR